MLLRKFLGWFSSKDSRTNGTCYSFLTNSALGAKSTTHCWTFFSWKLLQICALSYLRCSIVQSSFFCFTALIFVWLSFIPDSPIILKWVLLKKCWRAATQISLWIIICFHCHVNQNTCFRATHPKIADYIAAEPINLYRSLHNATCAFIFLDVPERNDNLRMKCGLKRYKSIFF